MMSQVAPPTPSWELSTYDWMRRKEERMIKSARISDLVHFIINSIGSIHRRVGDR